MKTPVVEIEAIKPVANGDDIDTNGNGTINPEDTVGLGGEESHSEPDSDDSDAWETQSLYEDALQEVEDEQLRDRIGNLNPLDYLRYVYYICVLIVFLYDVVPDACTLEEAVAYRQRLREIGKAAFVDETIRQGTVSAKKLCTAFGVLPPAFLEGAPDEAYQPLLAMAISREFSRRQKLPQYNTVDDAVKLLRESKNVIVLTGAGVSLSASCHSTKFILTRFPQVSTSLGIPDFRSKDTGLYSKLEHLGLSDPQEVFDIDIFLEDPSIFFSVAKDILPTEKKFSPTHAFIRLLQDKGKLLTNYTQNIDNIEANAGVLPEKIVQCHGSFATATCVECRHIVQGDSIFEDIKKGTIPECAACKKRLTQNGLPQGLKRKRSSNAAQGDRKDNDQDNNSDEDDYELPTPGVMKVSQCLVLSTGVFCTLLTKHSPISPSSERTSRMSLVIALFSRIVNLRIWLLLSALR